MNDELRAALKGWPDAGFDPASPHAWAFRDLWSRWLINSCGMLTDAGRAERAK